MTDRIVFFAWGAYVAQIVSASRVKVWFSKPQGSPFPPPDAELALDMTPNRTVDNGTFDWQSVEIDDHNDLNNRGATEMGGTFPWNDTAGAVYLSRARHDKLLSDVPTLQWPQPGLPGQEILPHHLIATLYITHDGGHAQSKRYHGFHAKMLSKNGTKGEFHICDWDAGTDFSRARHLTLDLETDVDWIEDEPMSTVKAPGDVGSLFIRWKTCDTVSNTDVNGNDPQTKLYSPKLPLGLGRIEFYYLPWENPHA
jgi:hypothetical protein